MKLILYKAYDLIILSITIFTVLTVFTGCTLLPGMQNISMVRNPYKINNEPKFGQPLIIPITAPFIARMSEPPYIYHIARQDILNITIWQHPEFDRPAAQTTMMTTPNQIAGQVNYPINSNGNIYFPLVGYLHVEGKTIDEVRTELTKRLRIYIRKPQVNVNIAEYRSKRIYVLGEVNKPGLLFLNDQPLTILDALMLGGGIDLNTGDPRYIYIIRGNIYSPNVYWLYANTPDTLVLAENFRLHSNDIVYVSTAIVTRWNRFLSQLLPTLQTIWYTKAITGK